MNRQLPSSIVTAEFGEVNVRPKGGEVEITLTIAMKPEGAAAEGWQTGVGLDASLSMLKHYGRSLVGIIPPELMNEYVRKGWVSQEVRDGESTLKWHSDGSSDAINNGFLSYSTNEIEPKAREFISHLADNLDADGGTTVVYWGCGDGSSHEVLGDFTAEQCRTLAITGPKDKPFGAGTQLLPVLKYFVGRFAHAKRGMYVFLTDGRIDDLAAVKIYTKRLCEQIQTRRQNPIKCVLIGFGDDIDESQMEQLDDLDTGTKFDIWDHKIAKEMRSLVEIFAEVVDEKRLIAPSARILDDSGHVVKEFTDGLTARVTFTMSATSGWFDLEVGGKTIRQVIPAS